MMSTLQAVIAGLDSLNLTPTLNIAPCAGLKLRIAARPRRAATTNIMSEELLNKAISAVTAGLPALPTTPIALPKPTEPVTAGPRADVQCILDWYGDAQSDFAADPTPAMRARRENLRSFLNTIAGSNH
jgi:hypothetical protein